MLAGGDWNIDLDGDSDRLSALEETLRGSQPIRGPPTFFRPSGDLVRLDGLYPCGGWAAQFEGADGNRLRCCSDHVPALAARAGRRREFGTMSTGHAGSGQGGDPRQQAPSDFAQRCAPASASPRARERARHHI